MQFGAYESLANSWKARKEFLRSEIAKAKGNSHTVVQLAEAPVSAVNTDKSRVIRHARNAELRRQRAMCLEMAEEEKSCQRVFKAELLRALGERRLMREEDEGSKLFEEEMKKVTPAPLLLPVMPYFTMHSHHLYFHSVLPFVLLPPRLPMQQ